MGPINFTSILVLCTGNICRSVIAERLLCQFLPPTISVTSAGIHAHHGHPAENMSAAVAFEHGVSLSGHIARNVTLEMLRDSGLILAMEPKHIAFVTSMAPEARGEKVMMFMSMCFNNWNWVHKDGPSIWCKKGQFNLE